MAVTLSGASECRAAECVVLLLGLRMYLRRGDNQTSFLCAYKFGGIIFLSHFVAIVQSWRHHTAATPSMNYSVTLVVCSVQLERLFGRLASAGRGG